MAAEKGDSDIGIPWQPGFWKRMPWLAMLSLTGFGICCGALAGILASSDGQEVNTWPRQDMQVSVSVLLALFGNLASLCLSVALTKAYAVAWWQKALGGTTLQRLQFDLSIQTSLATVFTSPAFDLFAVAAFLSVAIGIIDGPLVQRASSVILTSSAPTPTNITVLISNDTLPSNFSQYMSATPAGSSFLLTPLFGSVNRDYSNRAAIRIPLAGSTSCGLDSTCVAQIPAPGFDISCNQTTTPYGWGLASPAMTLFNVSIQKNYSSDGELRVNLFTTAQTSLPKMASDYSNCYGNKTARQCVLRLATVAYPVTLSNSTTTLKAWQLGDNETVSVTTGDPPDMAQGDGPETAGGSGSIFLEMIDGIVSVAKSLYEASAETKVHRQPAGAGAPGDVFRSTASLSTSGSAGAVSNYITSNLSTYGTCSMTWEDPTTDIINTIRELMLRSAIAQSATNPSAVSAQGLTATESKFISIYRSHYNYLGLAIGCLSIEVIVIASLLVGWHRLGRSFSTDALEIARAFGAPLLQKGSSNDTIGNLMGRVGKKRVRYGQAGYEVRSEKPGRSVEELPPDEPLQTEGYNDEVGVSREERTSLVDHELVQTVEDGKLKERCKLEFNTEDRVGAIERGVLY